MISLDKNALVRHATLRQLQILVTVAHTGGYTRAAEALHLTQPTVSMQVKKLSDVVGMPLFERVGKKLHLTRAGKVVVAAAEDILNRLVTLGDGIVEIQGEVKGFLQVAAVTSAKYFMPHLLGSFLHDYTEVEPSLRVTNKRTLLERLVNNEDDFVIMGEVPKSLDVVVYPFLDNILVPVASTSHPLAQEKGISLQRLGEERFLAREPGSGTRQALTRLFEDEGLTLRSHMELGSPEAIKQAVMAGLGVSVLSLHSLRLELATGQLCVLDVEGFPLNRRWFAVHMPGKQLSLVARTFLDFLLEKGADLIDGLPGKETT